MIDMRFTLTYEGPLPPKQRGVSPLKAALRAQFEPQLREQISRFYPDRVPDEHRRTVAGLQYEALVTGALSNAAELDIVLLTPRALSRPGDADNRVKTLLDGLTLPNANSAIPNDDARLCLLEDDRLVSRYSVDARPWLGRGNGSSDSLVIIGVTIVNDGPASYGGQFLAS